MQRLRAVCKFHGAFSGTVFDCEKGQEFETDEFRAQLIKNSGCAVDAEEATEAKPEPEAKAKPRAMRKAGK